MDRTKIIIIGSDIKPDIHPKLQECLDIIIAKRTNEELLELLPINSLACFDMCNEISNTPKDSGNNMRTFLEKKYRKNYKNL